ncbi:endonuclease/exonuclease/phosphatase family protein [Rubrobacter aplysinae]|uniref:endonuclease/exonuclease/phosphatase family protein n=1 Tax=Rubrobacter aplysinae TaxID=909625 RepID=UPI00069CFFEE|nr:endonuclease/exonuclease/phosphatase family protein [Rubrobacter aplysinae]
MTFNVRGSQHRDGANEWPRRAGLNVDCIRRCAPHLIGFQELQKGNRKTYDRELSCYERRLGPGYENHRPWAYNAVYWDPNRLNLLDGGGFWLSETPDERSRSWGSSHVRSASWARFRTPHGAEFVHLNTHLDHESGEARVEGSRLILRRLEELTGGTLPAIVTGDFNCNPGYRTYQMYEEAGYSDAHRLVGNPPENTFHRFAGQDFTPRRRDSEARLDWVLVRDGSERRWETRSCSVVRDEVPPVYPSDHYPVVAELVLSDPG